MRWIDDWQLPLTVSPGEEVRILRRRAGWGAEYLAAIMDISRITVYRIENNEISLSEYEMIQLRKAIVYHQKSGNWPAPGPGQIRK